MELITEPVDEVAIQMTARVITDVGADVLCLVEASRGPGPALVQFNTELLAGRYGHGMLIDGTTPAASTLASTVPRTLTSSRCRATLTTL